MDDQIHEEAGLGLNAQNRRQDRSLTFATCYFPYCHVVVYWAYRSHLPEHIPHLCNESERDWSFAIRPWGWVS